MQSEDIGDGSGPSKGALLSIFLGGGVALVLLIALIVAGGKAAYDLYQKGGDGESQPKLVASADEGRPSGVEAPGPSTAKPQETAPPETTASEEEAVQAPVAEVSAEPDLQTEPPPSDDQRASARVGSRHISIGDPVVLGRMSGDHITRIMSRHERELGYCFEREMERNPLLNGRLVFRLVIGPDGRITQAVVAHDELNNSNVADCSLQRLRLLRFPPPSDGGVVTVSLPVGFGPTQ